MRMPARKLARLSALALVCLLTAAPGGCTPKGDDMTPGLKGVDANANGIRDDIDALITEKYSDTPIMNKLATQLAQEMQGFLESPSKAEAYAAARKTNHVISCIIHTLPADAASYDKKNQMIKDIEAYTANTKERSEKYWRTNSFLAGGIFSSDNESCDK